MKWSASSCVCATLLLICAGSVASQEISEESPGLYATRQIKDAMDMGSTDKLTIRSVSTLQGSMRISATREQRVSVKYVKKSRTSSRSRAIDFIDLIAVDLSRSPQGARLEMRAPNPPPWSDAEAGLVQLEIIAPENCQLEIEAMYFDVNVNGPFGAVAIPSSLGKLEVRGITGQLDVETANRRVLVEDISGDVNVATSNALLTARNVTCRRAQGRFRNDGGDIEIERFTGDISIKNGYGRIELTGFAPGSGTNIIRGLSGPVLVSIASAFDGQIMISNRYEDIEVVIPSGLSARLSLTVEEGGKIEAVNFPFKTDLVQPDRLNLVTGDGTALISASVRGKGNIYVRAEEQGDS